MDRAWEIAERLMYKKRTTRRVMRRQWKPVVDDLDGAFAMGMHAYLCDSPRHQDRHGCHSATTMPGFSEADRKKGIRTEARRSMIFRALAPVFLALPLAPPASAGATIRTPALQVPSGGSVLCAILNTSAKKSIQAMVRMRDNAGNIANEVLLGLGPLEVNFRAISAVSFGYCEAELTKGSKKDLRITLCAMVGGDPAGCVNGT